MNLDAILSSYLELIESLTEGCLGVGVLDGELDNCRSRGAFDSTSCVRWLREQGWEKKAGAAGQLARMPRRGQFEVALALSESNGKLLAIVGVTLTEKGAKALGTKPGAMLRQRLKPALDCLHRELASASRTKSKVATLSERTRDLEWLFQVAAETKSAASNQRALEELLATAAKKVRSAFAALIVPEQRVILQHTRQEHSGGDSFETIFSKAQSHLLAWAQRHHRPLILNRAGAQGSKLPPCKILALPVTARKGATTGVMAFLNPSTAADYVKRQAFLGAHVARHAAHLLESQFDLATGLLTRPALEGAYESLPDNVKLAPHSVMHIDIDDLHVINNVHGFSAGDDVIVRVANLLAPPIISRGALAARISGDQFALVLLECDTQTAASIAAQLQRAVAQKPSGPAAASGAAVATPTSPVEITLSCGITTVSKSQRGLSRALAAAETACEAAKDRGRNRIETYACDDSSIIQRHGDSFLVGSLRDALKTDRFLLFAQPIVPLRNPELPGGYEVLIRLLNPDNTPCSPGEFLPAAQRYQLMPAIDRWVLDHTLSLLDSYSGVISRRRLSFSVNVTAHSLADDKFVEYLLSRLQTSRLPPGLLTVEITEQSAVRNLPFAIRLMNRLRKVGCGVALDDFGTGTNSLVYLRDLPVTRVKIDGSFVRDIVGSDRAASTLKGIIELLRPFNVETVAECTENAAIAQKLRQLGVDYAQGYAFGRPEPLPGVLEGLKQDESRKMHAIALEI